MAVRITRKDKSAGELRQEAARCRDGKAARRMLAIALVLDGVDRKTAAENCGMDRQTLRDWAHRYNAEGVSGLFNRRPPDPPCLLSAAPQLAHFYSGEWPLFTPGLTPVRATDPENDTLEYTLEGTDAASFDIDRTRDSCRRRRAWTTTTRRSRATRSRWR